MSGATGKLRQARLLDGFVGDWRNSGIVHPGRFGPGGAISGETRFHWQMQGRWLCFDSRLHLPGLGNLLVYEGRLQEGDTLLFDQIHPAGAQRARVVYVLQGDGRLLMRSQTSADGATWSTYFETLMTRS